MRRQRLCAPMHPDHDWTESDIVSMETLLDEDAESRPSRQAQEQRDFERHYGRFLERPEIQAMDAVTALRTFLARYPRWKVSP